MYLNTVFKYIVFKYSSAQNTLSECISRSSKEKLEGKYTEWPNPQIRGENRQSGLTD